MPARKSNSSLRKPSQRTQMKKAFWKAIDRADTEEIRRFAALDPSLVNTGKRHYPSPLWEAVSHGLPMVKLMLSLGAKTGPGTRNTDAVLLGKAATWGEREVGQFFISMGMKPSAANAAGLNDVQLLKTILSESPDAFEAKMGNKGDMLMHVAARAGSCEVLQFLFAEGADPNRPNDRGQFPLSIAAFLCLHPERSEACVTYLLNAGADPNLMAPNHRGYGETTLHGAVCKRDEPLCQQLLAHGGDPNVPCTDGRTALHFAACETRALVRLLLDHCADPAITCDAGKTALDYARRAKKKAIVNLLGRVLNS